MKKFYVMCINLDNGWTTFNCSAGSGAHRMTARGVTLYTEREAEKIIKEAIKLDKKTMPACWENFKYVLVER